GEVEVGAVGDAFELAPAPRVVELDVGGAGRVVRELLRIVWSQPEPRFGDAELDEPTEALLAPVLVPARRVLGWDEVLHLHLLELASAEDEVPGRDLVAERLADLRDP